MCLSFSRLVLSFFIDAGVFRPVLWIFFLLGAPVLGFTVALN